MRRSRFATAALALTLAPALAAMTQAGCVFSHEGPETLPSVASAGSSVRGGHINLVYRNADRRPQVEGELIAVDRGSLVVLTDVPSLVAVPIDRLVKATLHGWKSQPGVVNGGASLATLSTLTHGFFLVLTVPFWGIAGGAMSASEASAARLELGPRGVGTEFRKFARFPAGLPQLGKSNLGNIARYGLWDRALLARVTAVQPARRPPAQRDPLTAKVREQLRQAAACGTGADLPLWCTVADEWPVATRPTLEALTARHLGLRLVVSPGDTWGAALTAARPVLVALELGPPATLRSVVAEDDGLAAAVNEALLGAEVDPAVTAWLVAATAALAEQPAVKLAPTGAYFTSPTGQLRGSRDWLYMAERDPAGVLTIWVLAAAPLL